MKGKKTMPSMELMALELASNMAVNIAPTLGVDKKSITLWSDSATVLYWVSLEEKRLLMFVKNRCLSICQRVPLDQIRWVPGHFNPADIGTRGIVVKDFRDNQLWKFGPDFLWKTGVAGQKEPAPQQFQRKQRRK